MLFAIVPLGELGGMVSAFGYYTVTRGYVISRVDVELAQCPSDMH